MAHIASLQISHFRNLSAVVCAPSPTGLNIIHGQNGSGKTSLLEAIHYLSLGRSFRTNTAGRLVHHQADKFTLFAQIRGDSDRPLPVGAERGQSGSTRWRIDERETTSIAEVAANLPIRIINSQSHNMFEAGPLYRRKYLDWGLFYGSERFLPCWRQFERIIRQRNTLLRERRPKRELDSWTEELVKYGLELSQLRQDYVRQLLPYFSHMTSALLSLDAIHASYLQGWDESETYAAVLEEGYADEYRLGSTQWGPHRADLDINIEGVPAKYYLSRGQQKLLVCAMMLAQGMFMAEQRNKRVIYLVDDLPAELDKPGRDKLMAVLARQNTQVFITAIEKETVCDWINGESQVPNKLFHVEHGCLREIA